MGSPPALRKPSLRETLAFLVCPNQAGVPAVASPDAVLGFAVYTYQSGEVAFGQCGASGSILWRAVGPHSRGHSARGDGNITQRAKVGYCPGCSTVAHVAAPAAYDKGAFCPAKATALHLWQFYGPWGPRRLVALEYAKREKYLPRDFDWAASSVKFRFPRLPHYAPASEGGLEDMYLQSFKPLTKTLPEY